MWSELLLFWKAQWCRDVRVFKRTVSGVSSGEWWVEERADTSIQYRSFMLKLLRY